MKGDDARDLPEIDRSLLDAARGGFEPSSGDRKRLRAAVMASVAGGAALGSAATASAAGSSALFGGATMKTWLVVGALVMVGGGGVAALATQGPAPEPPRPPESSPPTLGTIELAIPAAAPVEEGERAPDEASAPEEAVALAAETPPLPEARRPRALATPVAPEPTIAPAEDPLRAESALLRRAHAAITSGAGAEALAILDEHARRFPSGAMVEERLAARVLALCAAGDREGARAEGAHFLAEHPRSLQAARVRASCAGE